MGGVCRDPEGQYFVWRSPFSLNTQERLVCYSNPNGYVTINDLEIGALLMQILIFAPRVAPLAYIHTYANRKAERGWSNRGSISTASPAGPILKEISFTVRRQHIHASVGSMPGEDNMMADAVWRLTHLPDRQFLSHFRTHLQQSKPWSLPPLPSVCRRQITTMLHNKKSPRASNLPYSRRTTPTGTNSGASAAGSKLPPTLKALNNPLYSSKSSHLLELTTPFTTAWEN